MLSEVFGMKCLPGTWTVYSKRKTTDFVGVKTVNFSPFVCNWEKFSLRYRGITLLNLLIDQGLYPTDSMQFSQPKLDETIHELKPFLLLIPDDSLLENFNCWAEFLTNHRPCPPLVEGFKLGATSRGVRKIMSMVVSQCKSFDHSMFEISLINDATTDVHSRQTEKRVEQTLATVSTSFYSKLFFPPKWVIKTSIVFSQHSIIVTRARTP